MHSLPKCHDFPTAELSRPWQSVLATTVPTHVQVLRAADVRPASRHMRGPLTHTHIYVGLGGTAHPRP